MSRKGFTLVETIVTIALILTLMIVIIPTTANIIKGSNQKQYNAITSQIVAATKLYLSDNLSVKKSIINGGSPVVNVSIDYLKTNDYLDETRDYEDPSDKIKFVSVTITYNTENSELVYVVNKEE